MKNSNLRKMADEAEARACLSALSRSGMSLSDWARSQGLDGRSLRAWQTNLSRRMPAERVRAQLVELVPAAAPRTAGRYVIRVADVSIEVGDDFDSGTLERILEALRGC